MSTKSHIVLLFEGMKTIGALSYPIKSFHIMIDKQLDLKVGVSLEICTNSKIAQMSTTTKYKNL